MFTSNWYGVLCLQCTVHVCHFMFFSLSDIGITRRGLECLALDLSVNTSIEVLRLIAISSLHSIERMLIYCCILCSIDRNGFGPEECTAIASIIANAKQLKLLEYAK